MGWYRAPKGHLNYGERNGPIEFLIMHYTVADFVRSYKLLTCRAGVPSANEVSAHYLVNSDGRIDSLVPEDKSAWHGGVSYWRGVKSLNGRSIGIEIVNDGYSPFPKEQIDAVIALTDKIRANNTMIQNWNIIGHSDIAPGRKIDPGKYFNWRALYERGHGIYPRIDEKSITRKVLYQLYDCTDRIINLR
jgi:N-acetylmuramoyl-L-alanine amidase